MIGPGTLFSKRRTYRCHHINVLNCGCKLIWRPGMLLPQFDESCCNLDTVTKTLRSGFSNTNGYVQPSCLRNLPLLCS
jgi:hypothetical protein